MSEIMDNEYELSFDGDEKVQNLMKLTSGSFTREQRTIKISQIGFTEPIKQGRSQTITGLTSIIEEVGVLQPIQVMAVPEESADETYQYILLDGLRRIFGAVKNQQLEIDAIVWNFEDKDKGMDLALYISLLLNRVQRRTMKEVWELYQILELQSPITPGTLEYLLQLESGDAMKLKDVMLCDYEEVKQALLNNEKNLEACYKMLQKLRKEEDRLAKEDEIGIDENIDGAESLISSDGKAERMSEQDVLELLEMANNVSDIDVESADFKELNQSEYDAVVQKVGERHPVPPEIKQGTFNRDGYACRCCGIWGVAFLPSFVYHHLIPVHCGGPDTVENGLTLCDSCHLVLHCCEKNGGKIPMTEDQFNAYNESEQLRIKKIIKYARVAVDASKRKGISQEKVREEANRSARHRMPGEGYTENKQGFAKYDKEQSSDD